ncbi:hypothetical protein [Microtetraspora sp. NBRC 16547]|uniref:hypothetical protein n=1 Tax=Microtetraspora sp. NBRC 16547 TaxID=3030993 RepID=UPI0024A0BC75|nr:hypothetical protein [Microtetraspora sp. NBRC 16547]GLW98864.1 hypothetical protein Misp02_29510 [Microtetraspora sp. NBRC 16547]
MNRTIVTLIALLCAACAACGAEPVKTDPPSLLLEPGQLKDGRTWTVTGASHGIWRDLDASLVPCGKRVIAPMEAATSWRSFTATDGTTMTQVVVSGVDAMDAFKSFYAECGTVGSVTSVPGPKNVARHDGEVEVAAMSKDRFIVLAGTGSDAELQLFAEAARTQLDAVPS